jgi:hypothetical protein
MQEVQLDAQTLCGGVLTRHILNGIEDIKERVVENDQDHGDGTITIVVKVSVDGGGLGYRLSVPEPKIKKPALKTTGQIVRENGGVLVVDIDEDEDGNQALPFRKEVKRG